MSRRYRQKGYMDDDAPRRSSSPAGPRPKKDGPRGRGLGAPTETVFQCARCGRKTPPGEGFAVDAVCGGCGADLHACVNCSQFDSSARWECRREIPERIAGKSRRNECELFEPKTVQVFGSDAGGGPSTGKSAFDALFDF